MKAQLTMTPGLHCNHSCLFKNYQRRNPRVQDLVDPQTEPLHALTSSEYEYSRLWVCVTQLRSILCQRGDVLGTSTIANDGGFAT